MIPCQRALVALLFAGCLFPITGQTQAALLVLIFGDKIASEKFHLSIDGGINASSMPGFGRGDLRLGVHFAMGAHLKLNDHWQFAPEFSPVNWRGQGNLENPFELPPEVEGARENSKLRLNYIDIPLLLQYRFDKPWYVSAGPQVSFLTSARQLTTINLASGNTIKLDEDVSYAFTSMDLGMVLDVGYAFKNTFAGRGFDLRLRYLYSLVDNWVLDDPVRNVRHSSLQFILTFPFVLRED